MRTIIDASWWALAIRGVLGILLGIAAFVLTGLTLIVLLALFGAYLLVDGVFAVVAGVRSRSWLLLLEGALGCVAGLIAIFRPGIALLAIVAVVAAWAIITGALELWGAYLLRRILHNDWLLAVLGVLSIVFGVLLIANPAAAVVTLVWVFGFYALVTGFLYLALAYRLRGLRRSRLVIGMTG